MVLVRVKVVCGGGLSGRVEGDGLWVACRRLLTHNIVKASICHEQRADGMNVEWAEEEEEKEKKESKRTVFWRGLSYPAYHFAASLSGH